MTRGEQANPFMILENFLLIHLLLFAVSILSILRQKPGILNEKIFKKVARNKKAIPSLSEWLSYLLKYNYPLLGSNNLKN